jgi:hypothetical protein
MGPSRRRFTGEPDSAASSPLPPRWLPATQQPSHQAPTPIRARRRGQLEQLGRPPPNLGRDPDLGTVQLEWLPLGMSEPPRCPPQRPAIPTGELARASGPFGWVDVPGGQVVRLGVEPRPMRPASRSLPHRPPKRGRVRRLFAVKIHPGIGVLAVVLAVGHHTPQSDGRSSAPLLPLASSWSAPSKDASAQSAQPRWATTAAPRRPTPEIHTRSLASAAVKATPFTTAW